MILFAALTLPPDTGTALQALQKSERGQDRVHHRVFERFDLVDDHAMDGGLHR